jgi:hypothetical protein
MVYTVSNSAADDFGGLGFGQRLDVAGRGLDCRCEHFLYCLSIGLRFDPL